MNTPHLGKLLAMVAVAATPACGSQSFTPHQLSHSVSAQAGAVCPEILSANAVAFGQASSDGQTRLKAQLYGEFDNSAPQEGTARTFVDVRTGRNVSNNVGSLSIGDLATTNDIEHDGTPGGGEFSGEVVLGRNVPTQSEIKKLIEQSFFDVILSTASVDAAGNATTCEQRLRVPVQ